MCRGRRYCTQLGTDPAAWDKECPLRLPSEYSDAIDTFVASIELLKLGEREACIKLLGTIDNEGITNWYIEHGQMSGLNRARVLGVEVGAPLPVASRHGLRSPARLQNDVFMRDGYRCRYCANRVIHQDFLRSFSTILQSSVFMRGTTNLTSHAIIHIAWPVADHVIPWSRGGATTMDNLVTSCAPCNYGKAEYMLEQIGLTNPLDRPVATDGWDGLTSFSL